MKTRMKKLISISTIPVLALTLLLVLGTVLADDATMSAIKPSPSLTCTTEYWWVGDHWEGTISGDIEGDIVWPPGAEPPKFVGQTAHYGGEFEIYDSFGELLLAGEGAGSTTVRHGKNSNWRTNGIVTEAGPGLEDWIGRRVYQDGHFTWAAPGVPLEGVGTFRVN
jgi:hypothetical protein